MFLFLDNLAVVLGILALTILKYHNVRTILKYHNVRTILKSNIKTYKEAKSIPLTHKFLHGSGTSIKG
jgi:hypothetical protein